MRLMKTVKNARQKSVMDVTDRNLGTGENRDRNQMVEDGQDQIMAGGQNQIMAGGQNQKRGQSRDVAAVIGAMKKNGEKETRR